jgi:hypothetical protein
MMPEQFKGKKMRNKKLTKFTYFGKHFIILSNVFRETKIRISSGSGNSIKHQARHAPDVDKCNNSICK